MLQFQLDNLDGLDASLHSLYEQTDSGFQLKVKGIDDPKELKSALQKERENNKTAKSELDQIKKEREEAERKILEEQGKYKDLSERERQEKLEALKKAEDLQRKIAEKDRAIMVRDIASSLTSDELEQQVIQRFAMDYVEINGDEVKWNKSEDQIKEELGKFVRSKANGSNDGGNNKTGGNTQTITREGFDKLNAVEKMKFIQDGGAVK
ncbi:MAG: hypothetical protein M0R77_19160 [Gammaproteobacteria bacterium]|nr:hypothetical protein [Gammaproteobacteria bacterium]